jgi:hypothetical protein
VRTIVQLLARPFHAAILAARNRHDRATALAAHGLCRICEIESIHADGLCLSCWGNDRAAP